MLRISKENLSDLVGWLALGVVAGGRTGWWLFYHRNIPGEHEPWWEPIAIWHGGMSFHGGLAGVLIVLWIWSKHQRAPLLNVADCLALVTPIGLCLGRIANFINGELVGRVSHVPWAMIFPPPSDPQPRHPSQIYEAILEGPVLLGVVWAVKTWKNRRDGQIAATFVIAYAVFRFLVEFTRQPDSQLGYLWHGWLTMGQLLSLAIGLAGAVWWMMLNFQKQGRFPSRRRQKNDPTYGPLGAVAAPSELCGLSCRSSIRVLVASTSTRRLSVWESAVYSR